MEKEQIIATNVVAIGSGGPCTTIMKYCMIIPEEGRGKNSN